MDVLKYKRNSIQFPKNLNIVEYSIKNDSNQKIIPKKTFNKNNNQKRTNNIYIKSNAKLKKNTNDLTNLLTYKKTIPSKISKDNKNKNNNIKASKTDKRTEKNEDTVSTVPLTKENIENKRALSCEKRHINKDMVFVKKKIQGNPRNSFILNKSEEKTKARNNSCFCIGNIINNKNDSINEHLNNNSVDYGKNNQYIKKSNYIGRNMLNSFDNDTYLNNKNFLNTNYNYLNNSLGNSYTNNMNNNFERKMNRTNNSVNLRKNKNIMNNLIDNESNDNKNNIPPNISNLKYYNGSQSIKYRNMIKYFDNQKIFKSEYGLNTNNTIEIRREIFNNNEQFYDSMREKRIRIKNSDIKYNKMNNLDFLNNEYIKKENPNSNYNYELNNSLLKELNFEELYLILKKFEIINNNIILIGNIKNLTNKNLLEAINMCRIFIYDLYKFYLNSSFEGCPQNLFLDKTAELYLHFYSVILIISLGLIYSVIHRIKISIDLKNKMLFLVGKMQKGFLFFCDAIFENYIDKGINNIWISEIMKELNNEKIPYGIDHILFIKKMGIEGYKTFCEIIKAIKNINNRNNDISEQELFLLRNYQNKSINSLSQIKISDLEESFDENIFKIINFKNNYTNSTFKDNPNFINNPKSPLLINYEGKINTQNIKSKNRAAITSLLFHKENIHNTNVKNLNKSNISNKLEYLKNFQNKFKSILKPDLNKLTNTTNKKQTHYNYKNIIRDLKIKEPYLKFPPTKKYTLVLDLDETMISFQFIYPERGIGKMHLRPGLENFLEIIKEYYEIIVFTSGTREYADMILDVIEHKKKKKIFSGRLYREHTTCIGNKYIKDLSKIGRDLSKAIIVDNLPQSFKFQHENGILISSFYGDDKEDEDRALIELQKILIKIYEENNDVRKSIAKFKEEIIRKVSCLDLNQYKQIYIDEEIDNINKDIFFDTAG